MDWLCPVIAVLALLVGLGAGYMWGRYDVA
jgi:hypothetical protein